MPRPVTHEQKARAHMKSLGTYKPEFEPIIGIYAQLREQYDAITKQFVESNYKYSEASVAGTKKAPIVTTLESLRKDILSYASQLGLTPQGLLRADENAFKKPTKNALAEMLKDVPDE